jgi:hypothetical protein
MSDLKEKRQKARETEKKKAEDEAELNPKQYLELRSRAIKKQRQTTRPGSIPAGISGQYHIEGDRRSLWRDRNRSSFTHQNAHQNCKNEWPAEAITTHEIPPRESMAMALIQFHVDSNTQLTYLTLRLRLGA